MRMVIKASFLFDSRKGTFVADPVVLIENDQIIDLQYGEVDLDRADQVIDLMGYTLLPGLIDAHDHLSLSPQLENHPALMNDPDPLLMIRAIENMKIDLKKGITTSRCLGDKNFIDIYIRDAVEQGIVEGPRIITCTRGIKATHAHGSVGTVFNGKEEIRRAARENLLRGAQFLKLFITDTIRTGEFMPYYMTREEVRVVVEEAAQVGKKVAAHSIGGEGLTICIEEGVEVIEHAYFASDQQIEAMKENNHWVVLTPSIFFNDRRWSTVPASVAAGFRRNREEVLERHQAILRSGIKFAVGTDATHGQLDEDIIFLVNIGGDPVTVLQGVTINAAKVCDFEDQIGSVEIGKKADLVALKGKLHEDINLIKNIEWVMKNGEIKVENNIAYF
ncbi:amidohydrolase family protein [Alkalihalobacillus oceani]|uniref:amidohydrolase family protein n=1 Tax=Halalkalibacter oceani TaxID=1653776 RepID=UPI00203C930E|nr:amidohydrolase family protein [Halalkalibacter oceani]MCM3762986.1 amidohydrolase family protein [Halalkalibacter oceani]